MPDRISPIASRFTLLSPSPDELTRATSAPSGRSAGTAEKPLDAPDPAPTGYAGGMAGREAGDAHGSEADAPTRWEVLGDGGDTSHARFPEPIASGPLWPTAVVSPSGATSLSREQGDSRLFGSWPGPAGGPSGPRRTPVDTLPRPATARWEADPRSTLPGMTAGGELDPAPDDAALLVLSDALGAALDEECDLHGLEES